MGSFKAILAAAAFGLCLTPGLAPGLAHAQHRGGGGPAGGLGGPHGMVGSDGGRLGDMLLDGPRRRPEAPLVSRYAADGGTSFILDRTAVQPLLKFDGSNEIWALYAQPAPHGDVIYKNELGEPMLRASRLGGLTVFTATQPEGVAAALKGGGPSLQPPPLLSALLVGRRIFEASTRASRAARRQIAFDVPDVGADSAVVMVDAAIVTAEAFEQIAHDKKGGTAQLQRVGDVILLEGSVSGVRLKGASLTVTVVPGKGFAGRPSSAKIIRALR